MDTLDNANANPLFAINNTSSDIILQKEQLLLDLAKQNGDLTTNGKRSTRQEFDDEDDMGPETDVDAIDDVLVSPASNNHFNKDQVEEKATLETEHIKHEEPSTPPADLVHDTSGLIDNVAESCEDSDDEWNYYKGDTTNKENHPPSETDKEVCDIIDNDEMSHLNPNAAEFVPLSPKGRTGSPCLQALMNDPIISQSPKRGASHNVDKVPDPTEFECEIKSRPSEVHESNENGEAKLNAEDMVNLLNGKNIDDIEIRSVSTPIKSFKADEFHFGPNATPFSTPAKFDTSEALSTKAIFGDESTASYLEKGFDSSYACSEMSKSQVMCKEQDPMSTSFYHDKDDADDSNPFDLNKVHVLPDNIEDFLDKPVLDSSFNETISDLPEHDPGNTEKQLPGTETHSITSNDLPSTHLEQQTHTLVEISMPPIHEQPLMFDETPSAVPPYEKQPVEVLECWKDISVLQIPEPIQAIPIDAGHVENVPVLSLLNASHDFLTGTPDIVPVSHETESPIENVTSSPILTSSPFGNKPDDLNLDTVPALCDISSSILNSSLLSDDTFRSPETESIATTDVNSFLERSLLPDVTSPLSPIVLDVHDVIVKSDIIAPEFPQQQQIIATPTEVVKDIVDKKPAANKSKVTAATKKPAPTKPAVKPLVKSAPAASSPKVGLIKTKTPTTPVSSPKPLSKPAPKTPVTNGLAKAAVSSTLTKTTSTTSAGVKTIPSKPSKPATARPTTAPAATKSAAPATSRPVTLTNRTSTTTTAVKKTTVTSTVTNTKSTAKPTTATSPKELPKPRPTTTSATARPKSSLTSKPLTKTPDTEKSIKEATNKLTATRTAAATTKPLRKVEPKVPTTTRTITTKTNPVSLRAAAGDSKKPQELVKHPANRTKVTKTVTKVHENGIANEVITVTSTTNVEESQLIKDVSPIIENSQLLD